MVTSTCVICFFGELFSWTGPLHAHTISKYLQQKAFKQKIQYCDGNDLSSWYYWTFLKLPQCLYAIPIPRVYNSILCGGYFHYMWTTNKISEHFRATEHLTLSLKMIMKLAIRYLLLFLNFTLVKNSSKPYLFLFTERSNCKINDQLYGATCYTVQIFTPASSSNSFRSYQYKKSSIFEETILMT